MAFLSFPLPQANFLIPNSLTLAAQPSSSSSDTPKNQSRMYGGRSPTEEPDNIILHEPWDMPRNASPNHCAPGSSILLNAEDELDDNPGGRGRRFSILGGKRRASRASSVSSGGSKVRRSISEGFSGGKVSSLFDSNPFSFEGDPPKRAADIKPPKPDPVSSDDGRSSPGSLKTRECMLKFGELPRRPPGMRRANSITIGVLSRKNMLNEQNGGGGGPPRPEQNLRPIIIDDEPEPVDLGVVVKDGAKKVWRSVRGRASSNTSSSSTSSASASSPSRSSSLNSQTDSPHSTSSLPSPSPSSRSITSTIESVPPPAPSEEFAKPMGSRGLQAVTEESGSGAATPIAGRQGGSLGLENLHLRLEAAEHHTPRLTSTNLARVDSVERYREWASSSPVREVPEPTLKHPDSHKRVPSPPPRPADREGLEEEASSEMEGQDGDVFGKSPTAHPGMRKRSASHGANDYVARAELRDVNHAEREVRGETKETAVAGYMS